MKPTQILTEEHRIILRVLDCLEKIAEETEKNSKLDAETGLLAMNFIHDFADVCHHAKEEDILFVVMEENGFSRDFGPIGVMLSEHETGRKLVREMRKNLKEAAAGNSEAIKNFNLAARDFIDLLRGHIYKEDNILYKMANQNLSQGIMDKMLLDFKKFEFQSGGNRHSIFLGMTKELCQKYQVPFLADSEIQTLLVEFVNAGQTHNE
ncbi:hemerythrin domain-containing protein [bacterium]|nr:hemerythrin domain-containing protein [bacterium]